MSKIAKHGNINHVDKLHAYMSEKQRSAENEKNKKDLSSVSKLINNTEIAINNIRKHPEHNPSNNKINGKIGRLEEMYAKLSSIDATNTKTKKNLLMKNQEIKHLRNEIEVLKAQLNHAHQKKAENINFSQFAKKENPKRWCEGGPCVVSGGKKHRRTKRKNRRTKRKNRRTKRKN